MSKDDMAAQGPLDRGVRAAIRECAILCPSYDGAGPKDSTGCKLPIGHDGPHEFTASNGDTYQWETDWSCNCDECMSEDGDQCFLYWLKSPNVGGKRP